MSDNRSPIRPGAVLYWLGLALLLIGVVMVVWKVVSPPASLGI